MAPGPGTISQKSIGKQQQAENAILDGKKAEEVFKKRFFTKHGWKFYLIEKTKDNEKTTGVTNASGIVSFSRNNENKRATNLFKLRENEVDGLD